MAEGHIPVNLSDFPLNVPPMEESTVYRGELKRVTVSPRPSKRGVTFCNVQLEVIGGEYEGRMIMHQYLPLPLLGEHAKGMRVSQAQWHNAPFRRFASAFNIPNGDNPPHVDLSDPDSIGRFQEWVSKFYGNNGQFTIQNQEFPEGSGTMRSGVSDYVP